MHLVGNRQGKKVVRWGHVGLSCLVLTAAATVAAAAIFLVVASRWNPVVLLVGPAVGVFATLMALVVSFRTPIHQLPLLHWYP